MKIAIFGAAGIIGQTMRLAVPAGVEPIWIRKTSSIGDLFRSLDLTSPEELQAFLEAERPDAIVNLAGESRPDMVEKDPERFRYINAVVPGILAAWCHLDQSHYVHVSTQAVFSGNEPPYGPDSPCNPVNEYGRQKLEAEERVRSVPGNWTIIRPTFVLGVRPMLAVGRMNPAEQMLASGEQRHTHDRWFSVSFAEEVAGRLWEIAMGQPTMATEHIGGGRFSRHQLAGIIHQGPISEAVGQDAFPGIAPRPQDTTYGSPLTMSDFFERMARCKDSFNSRQMIAVEQRAREIAIFTRKPESECLAMLNLGFGKLHQAVAEDFRMCAPQSDDDLLEWYRETEAYIWELSAYHCDPGFNYAGMCSGVAEKMRSIGAKRVLCLGDGIGDLTLSLLRAGFDATYHDLAGSRTAAFARTRFEMYWPDFTAHCTGQWNPEVLVSPLKYDAVVSLDFLEHVTDLPAWTEAIRQCLKPGGLLFSQNAFACGSGPDGSIPMHLARNDRWEKDWDPHLASIGFVQETSNCYRRAA